MDRAAPAVHYRHVRGITTGMDVVWQIEPAGDETDVTIVHEWTGPRVAAHRKRRRRMGHRPGVHPWHRVADAGGHPAGGGEGDMSEPRRVVITGIGAITPIGLGVDGLWDGLRRRTSAVRCITRFDPSVFKSRIAGEVHGLRRRPTTSRSAGRGGSTATPSSPSPPPAWRWPTPSSTSRGRTPTGSGR